MHTIPQLLYFDIRGRAEPIRLLFEDLGVEYVDLQVTLEEWGTLQASTPFRRMPVYQEGEMMIPESFAILNYLGRKHNLLGEDERARVRCDVTLEAWKDYGNRVGNSLGAKSRSPEARKMFLDVEQPALLDDLESYYKANNANGSGWAGTSSTIADYVAFSALEGVTSKLLARYPALDAFQQQFGNRPNVKGYLGSSRRPAALFYGPKGKIYPA